MISPATTGNGGVRRHDLAFPAPAGWREVLAARPDLGALPLVATWADSGFPLVCRRPLPADAPGVPLGLPLPPALGKERIALVMPARQLALRPPIPLFAAIASAPRSWWPVLGAIVRCAADNGAEVSVFGSLACQVLTGLDYLTERSDLDILLRPGPDTVVPRLVAAVAGLESAAPMRIDGELVRSDGLAVNWRELIGGASRVLAKATAGVALVETSLFSATARVP